MYFQGANSNYERKRIMTFSEQFKEIFELICEKIGVVIDWSQENVVPYVMDFLKRYVAYNIVEEILLILFGFALIVGAIFSFMGAKLESLDRLKHRAHDVVQKNLPLRLLRRSKRHKPKHPPSIALMTPI